MLRVVLARPRLWRGPAVVVLAAALLAVPVLGAGPGQPPDAELGALPITEWDGPDAEGRWHSEVLPAGDAVLLGAAWDGEAVVEVRARADGEWGRWMPFLAIDDHAPEDHGGHDHGRDDHDHDHDGHGHDHGDHDTSDDHVHSHDEVFEASPSDGRDHHDPIWIGASEQIQLRVQADAPVPVELDTISMDASEMAAHSPPAPRGGAAIASDGPPEIIPRSAWDPAGECRPRERADAGDGVEMAHVHHTVMFPNYSEDEADDVVRALCLFHVEARKFRDLGYHFLIDQYGRIYEGRAGSLDRMIEGGHAAGFNSVSMGVSLMGDFETDPVPEAAVDALERFLAWLFAEHGVDPRGTVTVESTGGTVEGLTRFEEGDEVELPTIVGHRDTGSATLCPGRYLYAAMDGIGERVEARMATAAETGEAPVEVPEPEDPVEETSAEDEAADAGDGGADPADQPETTTAQGAEPTSATEEAAASSRVASAPELSAGATDAGLRVSALAFLTLAAAAAAFEWRRSRI